MVCKARPRFQEAFVGIGFSASRSGVARPANVKNYIVIRSKEQLTLDLCCRHNNNKARPQIRDYQIRLDLI